MHAARVLRAGAPGTAANPTTWQVRAAAAAILRALDTALGRGTAANSFRGLVQLTDDFNRKAASTTSPETDVRRLLAEIVPTGRGAGDGPHCLIGGAKTLRALMATTTGQRGQSGWRRDARTGMVVYHYMGLPYYRVDTDESGVTAPLFAANLGPTGLCLVHACGTAESYGLQVDAASLDPATGKKHFLVHGAWALVAWEKQAIFRIDDVPIVNL